eukprot:gnl/MRDRNA2_/MRDRNA2_81329_c0_seq1.p1 gnl/MRDRNA2_/MRDRNA2_81329_c0~~gnl/MRDRNA2_/MRDRNA2_81329_c0_seq1.p1  ORF type:complete len:337 (+),score=43.05 gnl/MRDRNA2_/MRDRNA2_81329_c0_seq1:78-1088(+)
MEKCGVAMCTSPMLILQGTSKPLEGRQTSSRPCSAHSIRADRIRAVSGSGLRAAKALKKIASSKSRSSSVGTGRAAAKPEALVSASPPLPRRFNFILANLVGEELASIPDARAYWTHEDVASKLATTRPLQSNGEMHKFVASGEDLKPGVALEKYRLHGESDRYELTALVVPKPLSPDSETKAALKIFLAMKHIKKQHIEKSIVEGVNGSVTYKVVCEKQRSEEAEITIYRIIRNGYKITHGPYGEYDDGARWHVGWPMGAWCADKGKLEKHTLEDTIKAFQRLNQPLTVEEIEQVEANMASRRLDSIEYQQFAYFAMLRRARTTPYFSAVNNVEH